MHILNKRNFKTLLIIIKKRFSNILYYRLDPYNAFLYYNLGDSYNKLNQFENSINYCKKSIELYYLLQNRLKFS